MSLGIGQIFSRGLDGLNVTQRGLAVTSNNIANMNTKGYARQQIIIGSNATSGGGGASVLGVTSIVSPFVELQLFNSSNSFGFVDGRRQSVAQVEEMFNESKNDGLGKAMNDLFNSFSALSNDAASMTNRQSVRDAAARVASKFNSLYRQLNQMRSDISAEVTGRIDRINSLSEQIANLNGQIQGNPNPESVLDLKAQRLSVLRELSEEVNVSYYEQGDIMQVSLAGSISMVNGTLAGSLSVTNDLNVGGEMTVNMLLPGTATGALDVTDHVTGGRLGGNLLERNTTLNDRLAELDELAFNLAQRVNAIHSTGYSLGGTTGISFFEPIASQDGAALNIKLDALIESDLGNIAAAQEDPAVSGVADNRIALQLHELQNTQTMSGSSQTFAQFYQGIVGSVGTAANAVNRDYQTQANLLNQLEIQRESVSGVNLDEEGANIIRFQKAFQASSRLISIADELMESILNI